MNRGQFRASPLQQQVIWSADTATASSSSVVMSAFNFNSCHEDQEAFSPNNLPSLSSPSLLFSHDQQQSFPHTGTTTTSPGHQLLANRGAAAGGCLPSLHDGGQENHHMPESWSQMLLAGLVGGDQERCTAALLSKGMDDWGDHAATASAACMVGGGGTKKDEGSAVPQQPPYSFYGSHGHLAAGGDEHEMPAPASKAQLSQMLLASSPRSCVTTSLGSNMLDFSNSAPPMELKRHHHHSDNSSECNSTATAAGSAVKKPRVQAASSSAQSTLKVRKERLGDRITALHQIVSPFGKTDTASVLQETIGYIRFLLGQIEALSYPYMGHGNLTSSSTQNGPAGSERNPAGLFPEYPGQLLNHNHNTGAQQQQPAAVQQPPDEKQGVDDEVKRDLRSRGLCLVPVSCTSHFGGDNAADYWAPAALGGMFR
ncbi:transcription factor bHLH68 isoform X2 [Zea mays]|uniref:Transcription factor bHLH133 n=1 Tax=Zea mays TaxID=4577 RepID=B8A1K5_MAIZE|nr:uncharacterized protein LOC100273899 isoform X2 [Zea mays]ACL54054.1 unknown [Zea mays]AQK94011.1 Transcription factor bHLH133 [Zea mays]|eukprot:XP_008654609.1 transcription factor bHLH133 isoform X2 [Zea mays]